MVFYKKAALRAPKQMMQDAIRCVYDAARKYSGKPSEMFEYHIDYNFDGLPDNYHCAGIMKHLQNTGQHYLKLQVLVIDESAPLPPHNGYFMIAERGQPNTIELVVLADIKSNTLKLHTVPGTAEHEFIHMMDHLLTRQLNMRSETHWSKDKKMLANIRNDIQRLLEEKAHSKPPELLLEEVNNVVSNKYNIPKDRVKDISNKLYYRLNFGSVPKELKNAPQMSEEHSLNTFEFYPLLATEKHDFKNEISRYHAIPGSPLFNALLNLFIEHQSRAFRTWREEQPGVYNRAVKEFYKMVSDIG
jgi:hypothetical protein